MMKSSLYWNNRTVFVTGVTGLLGPWLVKTLLEQGARVVVLIRECDPTSLFALEGFAHKVTVVQGDLLDFQLLLRILNESNIETVFHLGAQAIVGYANRSPISTFKSNIEGTWNLLEACRQSPWVKRIVVASSDKAYGEQTQLPYTEEMPLQGRHPYDVSKSCTDLIAQSYAATYKLPVSITRCGNFFGGGDVHLNRIVPGTIDAVLRGVRPIIRSNGLLIRDYIYVRDVVDAYLTLAERMEDPRLHGQAFNFSTDKPLNVIEIVDMILRLMKRSDLTPIIQNNATHEIPAQHLSSAKAAEVLGWKARWGVERGLIETIEWYAQHADNETLSMHALRQQGPEITNQSV